MATLLQLNRVEYLINKDKEESSYLAKLYFCSYCLQLRSADDLQHEMECHYCPLSLDSLTPVDAASNQHKSIGAWECPACSNFLSVRAMTSLVPSPENPANTVPKRFYYQACWFCRWTSREVGIEDKEVINGAWTEKKSENSARIKNLFEYYKYLSEKEISEQPIKEKTQKKKSYILAKQLHQKHFKGMRSKAVNVPPVGNVYLKEVSIEPSKTYSLEELQSVPDDFYTKDVDFVNTLSLEQRLSHPTLKIEHPSECWPKKASMLIKQSLRCKNCEHNLIKPEYNASSIKFRIRLVAVNQIPEIRIFKSVQLFAGKRTSVILSVINPTEHVIHLSLHSNPEDGKKKRSNAKVELPTSDVIIAKYDETAELGMSGEDQNPDIGQDDPDIIAYRRGNKVGFNVYCTPNEDLSVGTDVWITFGFKHEHYSNTSIPQLIKGDDQPSKPEANNLDQVVFVNLGKIQEQ